MSISMNANNLSFVHHIEKNLSLNSYMCEIQSQIHHCLTFICWIEKLQFLHWNCSCQKHTNSNADMLMATFFWYYIAYFHHKKLDNASTSKMSKTTNTDLLHIISVLSSSLVHTYTRSQPKLKRTKLCVVVKHQTCGDPHHQMSIYRATMKCP